MAEQKSYGGGRSRRHPLQRAGGVRNVTLDDEPHQPSTSMSSTDTSNKSTTGGRNSSANPTKTPKPITPDTSSTTIRKKVVVIQGIPVRNKVKQNQTLEGLLELQRRIERTSEDATNGAHTKLFEQSMEVVEILSSMREINQQNESTIQNLQQQLIVVTEERDAARRISNELEDKLHKERKSFADVSHKNKRELEKVKRTVAKLGKKCKRMEIDLKVKDEAIKFWEVSRVMTNLVEGETMAMVPTADVAVADSLKPKLDGEEKRPSENRIEKMGVEIDYWKDKNKKLKIEVDYWKDKYEKTDMLNDELVGKIDEITDENCRLLTKCQKLESQLASSEVSSYEHIHDLARNMESSFDMQAENEALHHSMDDAIQLASENIANFYEGTLATLNDELIQASLLKEDLFVENEELRAKLLKETGLAHICMNEEGKVNRRNQHGHLEHRC